MKQLLILSGKGGTGKTTIASAFIKLANAKAYADCDVDAPNLHLIMNQNSKARITDYFGMPKAVIDPSLCSGCGLCQSNCRFDAIKSSKENGYSIDEYACEGCGVCEAICPARAISMNPSVAGELKLYLNDSLFSTAQLKMGSGTSGKLVTEVKNQLKQASANIELAIIDGSPGIGCPVIASLSGTDMVLIVAEPSISGISDMERILSTADKFKIKTAVCINKYNTNLQNTEHIITYCQKYHIPYTGRIPYDTMAVEAINDGSSIVTIDCPSGDAVKNVYRNTISLLFDR
ncbi:MAG: ATP-binding protein [Eubacteriales bacterium]|nr:ATP-binding protein [Eubacteriales bacterium]